MNVNAILNVADLIEKSTKKKADIGFNMESWAGEADELSPDRL